MTTLIDLYSGGGGYAKGFIDMGFKVVAAVEKDEAPAKTYQSNIKPKYMFRLDITRLDGYYIKKVVGDDIKIVIASPPCEAFTSVNRGIKPDPIDRLYGDPLGRLTLHAIRLIIDLQPEIFIIENVPGIKKKPIPEYIKMELEDGGYTEIYFNKLNAADYGNPSFRMRIFISNIRIKPRRLKRNVVVEDVLKDLPDPRYPNNIPNHIYIYPPKRFHNKIHRLRWGDSLEYFRGSDYREYKQFIRLHPKKLAPTVMGKSRFIHPYQDRLLTVREQARLMGYPDDYIFYGGIDEQYNQIGESVPPPLSRAIADYILDKYFIEITSS